MGSVQAVVTGHVDSARLTAFINDLHGPVRRDLARRQLLMRTSMTKRCPRKTGLLVSTIRNGPDGRSGTRPYVAVTAGRDGVTDYLGYLIQGTRTHDVYPIQNRPNATLRFVVGGLVVFAKHSQPRGIRANNFMIKALQDGRS
jgi:hypothetical protein